jgi:hypothetical protein
MNAASRRPRGPGVRVVALLAAPFLMVTAVAAQQARPLPVAHEVFAESELERYLRALQNLGAVGDHPWSIRGFSAGEIGRIAPDSLPGPWAGRYSFHRSGSRLETGWIRPRTAAIFNTGFPEGGHDGPAWAGRGLTTSMQAGAYLRLGPVSLVVAPIVFRAENADFELAPTHGGEGSEYRNPLTSATIDLPQRFGAEPYQRIDPGHSTLRVDLLGVTAGFSTAAQQWGPGETHPLILGNGAGGFPHVFLGTARPLNVYVGRVHGRLLSGRLDPSPYVPPLPDELDSRRMMSGVVAVFAPAYLRGLELGFSRFFHREWPADGFWIDDLLQPFESLLKENIPTADQRAADNQLASVFARWNFPGAGMEVFGEFMREDHAQNLRILAEEPDDLSGLMVGFRKVWEMEGERLVVLRGEAMNSGSSHRERKGARGDGMRFYHLYQHHQLRQGHTQRGQLLASHAAHGGAGSVVGLDRLDDRGRWSVEWERMHRSDRTTAVPREGMSDMDVMHSLRLSGHRFAGAADINGALGATYNLNRNHEADAINLHLRLGMSLAF